MRGTDDRHERAEEDEHGDAGGEGHTEEAGHDADAEGVDGGHEDRRAGEGRQLAPRDDAGGVDTVARGAREEAHDPRPDALTVVEEEEEREHGDEEAGDDVRHGETRLRSGLAEVAAARAQLLAGLGDPVVDLGVGDAEGGAEPACGSRSMPSPTWLADVAELRGRAVTRRSSAPRR